MISIFLSISMITLPTSPQAFIFCSPKYGRLQSIHVPHQEREQLRSLFQRRNDLVKNFRRIKTLIKGLLLNHGVAIPVEFDNSHWSHYFRNWLDKIEFAYSTARMILGSQPYALF